MSEPPSPAYPTRSWTLARSQGYTKSRGTCRTFLPHRIRFNLSNASHPSSLSTSLAYGNTSATVIAECRFPGQGPLAGIPKIPTIIWYDRHGNVVKAGAEAEEQSTINTAEEQGWTKVELYVPRRILALDIPLIPVRCTLASSSVSIQNRRSWTQWA